MVQRIAALWYWLIDGLTDAVIACAAALKKRQPVQLIFGREPIVLLGASGKEIGRIPHFALPVVTDPVNLREKLAGVELQIVVPDAFVLHRKLNPLSAESAPFLETFVRHQIERITPWKAADTYFGISTTRIDAKPPKLAVSAHVVARRLLENVLAVGRQLKPDQLCLVLPTEAGGTIRVPVDDDRKTQRTKMRAIVQAAVAGVIILALCRLAYFPMQITALQSQTADVESQIEDQEGALSTSGSSSGHFAADDILALREARPRVVETLEALSAALPDDDYLSSLQLTGDNLHISGISTKTSDLVPALEGSGHFRDVSFAEPITRVQSGEGNKFHLSMRVAAPGKVVRQ